MRTAADEQRQEFGAVLRSLRQFARAILTSPSHVCHLEYGRGVQPSVELLCQMAQVLEIPPTQLLAKAGKLPPDTMLAFWEPPAIPPILSRFRTLPEVGGASPLPGAAVLQLRSQSAPSAQRG